MSRLSPVAAGLALALALAGGIGTPWPSYAQPEAVAQAQLTGLALRGLTVDDAGQLTAFVGGQGAPGEAAPALSSAGLTVHIDGAAVSPASVRGFGASGEGITVLLAVDTSGTMRKAMPALKQGLARFAGELRPGLDASALGTIGDDWALVQGYSTDPEALAAALRGLEADAKTTALFESVDLGLQSLAAVPQVPSRRMLIVVSDGLNEKQGRTADECVSRAQGLGLQAHSLIYLATRTERYLSAKGALEKISRDSGALTRTIDKPEELGGALAALRASVEAELVLRVDLAPLKLEAGPHELTVRVGGQSTSARFVAPDPVQPAPAQPAPAQPAGEASAPGSSTLPLAAGGAALLVLLVLGLWLRGRRRAAEEEEDDDESDDEPPAEPAETAAPVVRLTVLSGLGGATSLSVPARGGGVGFDPTNALVLADESVSSHHAALELRQDGALTVRDLGSTNGTFVDEVRVDGAPVPLRPGARLRFGLVVLLCEGGQP